MADRPKSFALASIDGFGGGSKSVNNGVVLVSTMPAIVGVLQPVEIRIVL